MRFTSRPGGLGARGRRPWIVVVVALLLVAGGVGVWLMLRPGSAQATTLTATATSGTFTTSLTADGTITPARQKQLSFPAGGTVTSVHVAAGDRVTKGEVLARMDATALAAQRDAADASLTAASTQLADDVAAAAGSTQLAADRASVASARSQLAEADDSVTGATLRAPFTGTVSAVDLAVGDSTGSSGDTSAAGSDASTTGGSASTSSGTTSGTGVTVISTSSYVVDASVTSSDVQQIKKGMQARITPTGGTDTVYGVVSTVGVVAESSSGGSGTGSGTSAATFPVTVRVTGSTKGLYPGSSASVAVIVKQVSDVLTVPTQAVTGSGARTYVELVSGGQVRRTAITTGATYGAQTEVTKGLTAGDKVKVAGFTAPGSGSRGGNRSGRGFPGGGTGGPGYGGEGGGFSGGQQGGGQ